ncbi:MAG: hypothetical protein V1843_00550 [bacterium]
MRVFVALGLIAIMLLGTVSFAQAMVAPVKGSEIGKTTGIAHRVATLEALIFEMQNISARLDAIEARLTVLEARVTTLEGPPEPPPPPIEPPPKDPGPKPMP